MTEADKAQAQLAGEAASGGRLGQLVLDLWQRTRIDWGFASERLAESFRPRAPAALGGAPVSRPRLCTG